MVAHSCLLPKNVERFYGFLGTTGNTIVEMNDYQKLPFKEIAAAIRANPELFFNQGDEQNG